jgi:triosephosphate isomerase
MATQKKLVAGNWKMNGLRTSLKEVETLANAASSFAAVEIAVCPPFTLLSHCYRALEGTSVALGAQDCHWETSGAFTGDISAPMLAEAGVRFVILGHSERRAAHGETDVQVAAKAAAAHRAGLTPIICVGESLRQREGGETISVVSRQLEASTPDSAQNHPTVLAYEPIWAIGSGLTPTFAQIEEIHAAIAERLAGRFGSAGKAIRLLYGGSVKPENARDLMDIQGVDGALVGGASLRAADFLTIAGACF